MTEQFDNYSATENEPEGLPPHADDFPNENEPWTFQDWITLLSIVAVVMAIFIIGNILPPHKP